MPPVRWLRSLRNGGCEKFKLAAAPRSINIVPSMRPSSPLPTAYSHMYQREGKSMESAEHEGEESIGVEWVYDAG